MKTITIDPISYFNDFSDEDLYTMAMELQEPFISNDALIRKHCEIIYGKSNLVNFVGLGIILCKTLANRLKEANEKLVDADVYFLKKSEIEGFEY